MRGDDGTVARHLLVASALLRPGGTIVVSCPSVKESERLYEEMKAMADGVICRNCGGLMIRTGTCHTCTTCGETTGCGRA